MRIKTVHTRPTKLQVSKKSGKLAKLLRPKTTQINHFFNKFLILGSLFATITMVGTLTTPQSASALLPQENESTPVFSATAVQHFTATGDYTVVDISRDTFSATSAAELKRRAEVKAKKAAAKRLANAALVPSGEKQAYAFQQMSAVYGWGGADQQGCLVNLWNRESGWSTTAANSGSGAYGIPQALPGSKMSTQGADWKTNYETQINWGLSYIAGSYGSACGAWGHSNKYGWY